MLKLLFTPASPYKKQAKSIAILWTLLILVGCFAPATSFPKVDVPLADKWVHFLLFGGFTFFWLLVKPVRTLRWLATMLLIAVSFGCFIEVMQGILTFLGRSMELMDAVADSIGGLLGIGVFVLLSSVFKGG